MKTLQKNNIDWMLFLATIPLLGAGLITMRSLGSENNYFFYRQLIWIGISFLVFFIFSQIDWRFLRNGEVLMIFWATIITALTTLFIIGKATKGAMSWIHLGFFAIEPSDPLKLLIILILAKYFSRRHIEIAHIRHIIVSGMYVAIPTILVFLQPDAGSTIILSALWLGMVMVSGVSKKHLFLLFVSVIVIFSVCWLFIFKPYQKARILTFLDPFRDVRGAGYNAAQSMIAVGSGQIFGKGIGFGTQSRLHFLPEYQTDFIFAAFAEEWGLTGVLFVFIFYAIVIWRILRNASSGQSNFETFFGIGLAILLMTHITIHVGMNIGLFPITGITLPLMSYGGSNMLTIFAGLGILMGMQKYSRQAPRGLSDDLTGEFVSV